MSIHADRVLLITGAASGIGRQLALDLAAEGARIGAVDRNAEALAALGKHLDSQPFAAITADVTRPEEMRQAVAQVESALGSVDMLIASAGVGMATPALNLRADDMAALIGVNLLGVANSIEAVLPGMIQRRSGHIVALSSLASFRGMPLMAGYCASKAGVNALMEALRVELRGYNIHFTTVCPGWIRTPMTENLSIPTPDMMEVQVAARRILDAVRRRETFVAFPPGMARRLRFLRWLPLRWSDWVIGRMIRQLTTARPTHARTAHGKR